MNEENAIKAIRHVLSDHETPMHELASNMHTGTFDWESAASIVGVSRTKLYHWFVDTFKRHYCLKISDKDMLIIRSYIFEKMTLGEPVEALVIAQLTDNKY